MIKAISLSAGLVTSRHASMLEEGELVVAQDTQYLPNDPGLYRAWGRTRYIDSGNQIGGSSGKIKGVAYCPFDPNSDGASGDFLIAHRDNKYYTSLFTARTGTISGTTIDNVGTGTHLEACHADNKWYLFNGNPDGVANRVLKPGVVNPVSRRHGLVPVTHTPTSPAVTTAAGSWPTEDTFWGEGRFFFLMTEVVNPGLSDEIESAAAGTPGHVDLQKDGNGNISFDVIVTRPTTLSNSDATEIRVYMTKASLNQTWDNSLLARAFRVGTISPPNTNIRLSGNYTFYDPTLPATVTVVSGEILDPNNIVAADNAVGSVVSTATVDVTNWGFAVPVGAVVIGVVLWHRYRAVGLGSATINARLRSGAGPTLSTVKNFATEDDDFVLHRQPSGDNDSWGLTLVGADVNSANFGVRLVINGPSAGSTQVDSTQIRVFTSSIPTIGPAYPIIAIQEGNVLVVDHAHTPPPVSSTGDIIDGCMVVNNVTNDREFAWSLPAKYDYFPTLYKAGVDTREKDKVMVIRRLGDMGMIFMRHQVIRLNSVPLSVDPEFNPGRMYEIIIPDHGAVSKQGVATFVPPGRPVLAAFVSHNGVYMTDGSDDGDRILTDDLAWETTVDVTQLDKAVLTNYPKKHQLRLDYIGFNTAGTENNRYVLIHYHPSHRKADGRFKLTGPNIARASCSCIAKLLAETVLIVGHPTDARLYVEDNGVDDLEGTGINMLFETREIYPAGQGLDATVVRLWYHHNGAGVGMTATSTPKYRNVGGSLTDHTPETFTPDVEGLVLLQHHLGLVEGVRFRLSIPDAGVGNNANMAVNHALYDFNPHGKALDT